MEWESSKQVDDEGAAQVMAADWLSWGILVSFFIVKGSSKIQNNVSKVKPQIDHFNAQWADFRVKVLQWIKLTWMSNPSKSEVRMKWMKLTRIITKSQIVLALLFLLIINLGEFIRLVGRGVRFFKNDYSELKSKEMTLLSKSDLFFLKRVLF